MPPTRAAKQELAPGTVAYWRFDGGKDGAPVTDAVKDLTGHGNDLRVDRPSHCPFRTVSLWAVFPLNQNGISTNWGGHELPLDEWWHVTVVNDGRHTTMYVDGCPLLRNPKMAAIGPANPGGGWFVGAYAYDSKVEQGFYGLLGDVRVDRPLAVCEFMLG
ncbi:LamG-like jellyroll fold domain-containing protein [Amycolatopsis sp. NPDC051903]|uniref:LamG-like jellyroll fold domain-containing protein n=1 Tax=Amycolatopsis sp. NPDC051903 TaxID=3363936 RepID=UPI0037B6A25E